MEMEKLQKEFVILYPKYKLKMRILVVVESIDVNDSSGSKANVALIQNIASCGFDMQVFHYTRKEIQLDSIPCISIPEKKWNFLYLLSRTERLFTRWTKINLNPYLESWFGFSFTFFNDTNSIASFVRKQKEFLPDLVLTLSKGASFRPHYALLQLPEFHDKWMAYVHDPFPFHYYPRPFNWIQPGYAQKEKFFRAVSQKAKYSAFPSQLLKEWMGSYFKDFLKTGTVIPHQISELNTENVALPSFFKPSKFSLLHAGNLLEQRNPFPLINAYRKFLIDYPEAKNDSQLLFVGPAMFHEKDLLELEKQIPTLVAACRNFPFKEIMALQEQVSVNIILESKSEISPFLPGKFPHCVSANRPILLLSPYYSETKRLLGANYSYWSEADDELKLYSHIETLYQKWKSHDLKELDREDLKSYLGNAYLKNSICNLN